MAYVRDISKIFASDGGVFKIGLFWYGQCAIIQKRTYVPPQKSYVKYTKNRYYLATKNISTFSNIALIN